MERFYQIIAAEHALPANSGTNRTAAISVPKTNAKVVLEIYAAQAISVASGQALTISIVDSANAAIDKVMSSMSSIDGDSYADGDLIAQWVVTPVVEALGSFKVQFVAASTSGVENDKVRVQLSIVD